MSAQQPLKPTYMGYVSTTMDAVLLFEGCLNGTLNHVARRPHDRERQDLIKSGNIFIYEEHASGIKRWTDGVPWSPSRILGNFLVYRELEKAFPPGEKKKALKRQKKANNPNGVVKPESKSPSACPEALMAAAGASATSANVMADKEAERLLIGSLVDSYPFKPQGLVKKTISVTWRGVPHHLVSYYTCDDVLGNRLQPPTQNPILCSSIQPRPDFVGVQNFRVPPENDESLFAMQPLFDYWHGTQATQAQAHGQAGVVAMVGQPRHLSVSDLPVAAGAAQGMGFHGSEQSGMAWQPMPQYLDSMQQQQQQPPSGPLGDLHQHQPGSAAYDQATRNRHLVQMERDPRRHSVATFGGAPVGGIGHGSEFAGQHIGHPHHDMDFRIHENNMAASSNHFPHQGGNLAEPGHHQLGQQYDGGDVSPRPPNSVPPQPHPLKPPFDWAENIDTENTGYLGDVSNLSGQPPR